MNPFGYFKDVLTREVGALARAGDLPAGLDVGRATMEPARNPAHGDLTTNAAMVLAKDAGLKPRDLAARLADRLAPCRRSWAPRSRDPDSSISAWRRNSGTNAWPRCCAPARHMVTLTWAPARRSMVEFVSVNPTGPLHVGHARGGVVGDVLASLLEKGGYKVTREFYINDAGYQIEQLAYSVYLRYREALGEKISEEVFKGFFPGRDWEYRGDYLKDTGEALAVKYRDRYLDAASPAWLPVFRDFSVDAMMELIKADMAALGVRHDVFSSERELVEADRVEAALATLEDKGLIYTGTLEPPKGKTPEDWEPRPQTLFRSTEFGDDVDRPLKKSDGSWTYFATDVAYHHDKLERGFRNMIDVWGADHGGYVKRMGAAVKAFGEGAATLGREALPDGAALGGRPAGQDVEARRRLRCPERSGRACRQGRGPIHHADAQERFAAGFRPRQGPGTKPGQSGILRTVRPCALPLGHAPCGGAPQRGGAGPGEARRGGVRPLGRHGRTRIDQVARGLAPGRRKRRRGA